MLFDCFGPADGLPAGIPSAIAAASDGSVWVGFFGDDESDGVAAPPTLARYAPGTGWQAIALPAGVGSTGVFGMAVDAELSLWVRTADGLLRRDRAGGWTSSEQDRTFALPFIDTEYEEPRRALAVAPDGSLWVGDLPDGLRVRRPDGTWRALRRGDGLAATHVTDIAFGPDGRVWLGTAHEGARLLVRAK